MPVPAPAMILPFAHPPGPAGAPPHTDPVQALAAQQAQGVLAVVTGIEGPSYRPLGATMALLPDGRRIGSLSSGCIEADLHRHADRALAQGRPLCVRYGKDSPWFDIRLPCGGGLDITLLPRPAPALLSRATALRQARRPHALAICPDRGLCHIAADRPTGWESGLFYAAVRPEPRFLIFGKGPETIVFAGLVHSAHFPCLLLSHDPETLELAGRGGMVTRLLSRDGLPGEVAVDRWTAAVLFYHDHDHEPPILRDLLATDACYIGAQGSRRTRDNRLAALRAMGVSDVDIARLKGPIGLVPSARDPRTLAISVLAEVLSLQ